MIFLILLLSLSTFTLLLSSFFFYIFVQCLYSTKIYFFSFIFKYFYYAFLLVLIPIPLMFLFSFFFLFLFRCFLISPVGYRAFFLIYRSRGDIVSHQLTQTKKQGAVFLLKSINTQFHLFINNFFLNNYKRKKINLA